MKDQISRLRMSRADRPPLSITIVQRPIGEAPEWVRDAWIGLQLPLKNRRKKTWLASGVLTGPKTLLASTWALLTGQLERVAGYAVEASLAIDVLSRSDTAAADWWRVHAPTQIKNGKLFIFDAAACRVDE